MTQASSSLRDRSAAGALAAGAAPSDATPVPWRAWYLLAVLNVTYVVALIDRKVPFILIEHIKADLKLSDTQIGLVTGFMFTFIYTVSSMPVARIADRYSRKWVMVASLVAWSALTSAGGFAANFWQLIAARAGVAIGESGNTPASHSMITSTFPERRRSLASALFMAGAPIGMLIGLMAGGLIADNFGWRTAMIWIGAPGLILALVYIFTIREPPRAARVEGEPGAALWSAVKILAARPTFRHLVLAGVINNSAGAAAQAFNPAFIMRTHGLSASETGVYYGTLVGAAGLAGALGGGFLADRTRKVDERIGLWFVGGMIATGGVMQVLAYNAPTFPLFLVCMALPLAAVMTNFGPIYPIMQSLGGARTRAMTVAIYLFLVNGVGQASGPLIAGILSDTLQPVFGASSLKVGLIFLAGFGIWAAVHYIIAAAKLPADLAIARARDRKDAEAAAAS